MNLTNLRRLTALLMCTGTVVLVGCANVQLAEPTAVVENVQKARASGMAPVAIGAFNLAPGKNPSMDQAISIRSNRFYSPYDNSFSKYLAQTLAVNLRAAGLLATDSRWMIQGELTQSTLHVPTKQGKGSLAGRFFVLDEGRKTYDKEHEVEAKWESSFVGVVAIPAAINEYMALYHKLIGQLLDDPEFRKAVSP